MVLWTVNTGLSLYLSIYIYICLYLYELIYILIYIYIVYLYINIRIYVFIYLYIYMFLRIYICLCIYIYMFVCVYIYVCVCIYIYTQIMLDKHIQQSIIIVFQNKVFHPTFIIWEAFINDSYINTSFSMPVHFMTSLYYYRDKSHKTCRLWGTLLIYLF